MTVKSQLAATLNNARKLYIAGSAMSADFIDTKDAALGWPGDLVERKEDSLTTVSDYMNRLLLHEYLMKPDLAGIMYAPGMSPWNIREPFNAERHCPFKVYRVRESDAAGAIFCATRNFTYNRGLAGDVIPYGVKGFVIVRKDGAGSVFNDNKAATRDLTMLGFLPGRTDFSVGNTETANDYLVQK